MASDAEKITASPAPKNDATRKNESALEVAPSKAENLQKDADVSSGYSRGEGQKPVSKAYKDNWNLIFREKKGDSPQRAGLGVAQVLTVVR